jgi:hypothetical protein
VLALARGMREASSPCAQADHLAPLWVWLVYMRPHQAKATAERVRFRKLPPGGPDAVARREVHAQLMIR